MSERATFAYADPPYLGCGAKHYGVHHAEAAIWDTLEAHEMLVRDLSSSGYDGWAMSLSSPSLRAILPLCPEGVRVMAWVKPFASFKPNVNPAYAWEPVIVWGGRPKGRAVPTVRDWIAASITLQRGLTGAKPAAFCRWLFEVWGAQPGDTLVDLFPGTGAVTDAWDAWTRQRSGHQEVLRLTEEAS